ncbi:MAG: hypothetical protein K0S67_1500 [Nitrososphaeraceae archaeon]|jgi:hypothetical protein|nr:hypothetical protein [Nitrososphaeraceae archaeon]
MCLNRKMSSFPILPIEAFTLNYNDKRGVDLEFRPRRRRTTTTKNQHNNNSFGTKNFIIILRRRT